MLDFIAPLKCAVCDEIITENSQFEFICDKCYFNIDFAENSTSILNNIRQNFTPDEFYISNAYALFSLRNDFKYIELVHSLKYQGQQNIAFHLGKLLGDKVLEQSNHIYDSIIPLPIHHAKKRERGFNQSELISIGVADSLKIPIDNKLLKRQSYTITQTLLKKDERKKNMDNVFISTNLEFLSQKSYLLIDDVLTTGSTLNSAAFQLLNAGAKRVDIAILISAR